VSLCLANHLPATPRPTSSAEDGSGVDVPRISNQLFLRASRRRNLQARWGTGSGVEGVDRAVERGHIRDEVRLVQKTNWKLMNEESKAAKAVSKVSIAGEVRA
jgi:hypothetical protein